MAKLFNSPFLEQFDGNGVPMAGAQYFFYITGTTTPKNTYSDAALTVPNTNPVVADSNGLFGPIYLAQDVDYKCILETAAGAVVGTRDPLLVINTSVIAHQGSLIVGGPQGQDAELPISTTNGASLRSDGTTALWRVPNLTTQKFLSGSGTYTTPANCTAIRVCFAAGGGGGGGCGVTTGPNGTDGGDSSFGATTALGGKHGVGNTTGTPVQTPSAGGTGGLGTALHIPGGDGGAGSDSVGELRPAGGSSIGQGAPLTIVGAGAGAGTAAKANTGGGGGGASSSGSTAPASPGGGGEQVIGLWILTPAASYPYVVGGGGTGGIGTGTGAATGGNGGSGFVYVEEYYF